MIQVLEQSQRRWRVGYTSASLASLQAAVSHGLGISLLPARAVLPTHTLLGPDMHLPEVTTIEVSLHIKPGASPIAQALGSRLSVLLDSGHIGYTSRTK